MTVVHLASIDGQRGMAQLVKPEDTMSYKDSSGAASTRSISEASSLERCWPSRSGPSSMHSLNASNKSGLSVQGFNSSTSVLLEYGTDNNDTNIFRHKLA